MRINLRLSLHLFVSLTFSSAAFAQAPVGTGNAPKSKTAPVKSTQKGNDKASVAPAPSDATVPPASAGSTPVTPVQPTNTVQDPAVAPVPSATVPTMPGKDPQIDRVTGEVIPGKLTTISFAEVNYDFGRIKEGEVVKHKFRFTNTGTNDLILENVKASCGCTALDWPKNPVAPGQSGEIETKFNSTGKSGLQMKYITITLNSAERLERITLSGEVIPKLEEHGSPKPPQGH